MSYLVTVDANPTLKPAPETEEDMMVEIFAYTERVVNMIRPRKLLFMAIGKYKKHLEAFFFLMADMLQMESPLVQK